MQSNSYDANQEENQNSLEMLGDAMKEHQESIEQREGESKRERDLSKYPVSLRRLPSLILDMIDRNITLDFDIATGIYKIKGFYKNGDMKLEEQEDGRFLAIDKKGEDTEIATVEDIVTLNFEHWKMSGSKGGVYPPLDKPWQNEFENRGYIKRQVTYIPL